MDGDPVWNARGGDRQDRTTDDPAGIGRRSGGELLAAPHHALGGELGPRSILDRRSKRLAVAGTSGGRGDLLESLGQGFAPR